MNTANDEPAIKHGATVYDGDEVTLTDATVRHVLRTPETGSFLRGDWTGYVNGRLVWRSRRGALGSSYATGDGDSRDARRRLRAAS